jgi:hypothetical protein
MPVPHATAEAQHLSTAPRKHPQRDAGDHQHDEPNEQCVRLRTADSRLEPTAELANPQHPIAEQESNAQKDDRGTELSADERIHRGAAVPGSAHRCIARRRDAAVSLQGVVTQSRVTSRREASHHTSNGRKTWCSGSRPTLRHDGTPSAACRLFRGPARRAAAPVPAPGSRPHGSPPDLCQS